MRKLLPTNEHRNHATSQRRLGGHGDVQMRGCVKDGTVELVEQRRVGRAWALRQRQSCCLSGEWARAVVAWVAWEHHVVDHQRVLAGGEQLRQPHIGLSTIGAGTLEDVILWENPARRQVAPGRRDCLHRTAQRDLLLEQPIACSPVLR
jgi:hypothetical protein